MRPMLAEAKEIESLYDDLTREYVFVDANNNEIPYEDRTDDEVEWSLYDLIEEQFGNFDRELGEQLADGDMDARNELKKLKEFRRKWFGGRRSPNEEATHHWPQVNYTAVKRARDQYYRA